MSNHTNNRTSLNFSLRFQLARILPCFQLY